MILKSADEGLKVDEIGEQLCCSGQTVREAIHAVPQEGINCLKTKQMGRKDDQGALDDEARDALRE